MLCGTDQMAFFASYLRHLLMLLDLRAEVVASPSQEGLAKLGRVHEKTVMVGFSAGRPHPLVVRAMKLARNRHAATIAIADATLSEVAKLADHRLYYSSNSPAFVRSHSALLGADPGARLRRLRAGRARLRGPHQGLPVEVGLSPVRWGVSDGRAVGGRAGSGVRVAPARAPARRAGAAKGCDPLDKAACLLPWPNDYFVKHGHLALTNAQMPRARRQADRRARLQLVGRVQPGADHRHARAGARPQARGAAPVTDIGRSLKRNQPIVVIDAKTGKRQLIWSELNMVAKNPRKRTLLHPPGHRVARGPPLHRRPAQPEALERQHDQGAARVPLYRRPCADARWTAAPHMRGHLRAAGRGRGATAAGCTWPGTSRSRAAAG